MNKTISLNLDTLVARKVAKVVIYPKKASVKCLDSRNQVIGNEGVSVPTLPLPGKTGDDLATGFFTGQLSKIDTKGSWKSFGTIQKEAIRAFRKHHKDFASLCEIMEFAILDRKVNCGMSPVKSRIPNTFGFHDVWQVNDYVVIVNSDSGKVWDVYINGVSYQDTALMEVGNE